MTRLRTVLARALFALAGSACSSSFSSSGATSTSTSTSTSADDSACGKVITSVDASASELDMCFPDHDGINGGTIPVDLTVDDTGFSKTVIGTQNDATAILTLKN